METTRLTELQDFFRGGNNACIALSNPRDPTALAQAKIIEQHQPFSSHLVLRTSGSAGSPKWVALSRQALLKSAIAVNAHLNVTSDDTWLLSLPLFHVGGIGILARSITSGAGLINIDGKWDAKHFHHVLESNNITLTSMVPTQIHDLCRKNLSPPASLRAVLIGGGAMSDSAYQQAAALGWPVIETYGMTEACSQIATADLNSRAMKPLPHWQVRCDDDQTLSIRGKSLMTGYLELHKEKITVQNIAPGSWWGTSDRGVIEHGTLKILGRTDRTVKILGELVDLTAVEKTITNERGHPAAVLAIPDARAGSKLALCLQSDDASDIDAYLEKYNRSCLPVSRISECVTVESFPLTPVGKIDYTKLNTSLE